LLAHADGRIPSFSLTGFEKSRDKMWGSELKDYSATKFFWMQKYNVSEEKGQVNGNAVYRGETYKDRYVWRAPVASVIDTLHGAGKISNNALRWHFGFEKDIGTSKCHMYNSDFSAESPLHIGPHTLWTTSTPTALGGALLMKNTSSRNETNPIMLTADAGQS
jgi:hypothetical protein